jgi:hypothetical protein
MRALPTPTPILNPTLSLILNPSPSLNVNPLGRAAAGPAEP